MNGREQEVVAGHHLSKLHPFRQILAHFFQQLVNLPVYLRRIGTRRLEYHARDTCMTVHGTFISITVLAQLHVGDIFQLQHLTVFRRTDNDIAKLFGGDETSRIFHRVLVGLVGILAERTRGRLDILLRQYRRHIRRYQLVLRHDIGFHPDAHTVIAAHNHHIAHAGDTENLRFQVDTDIVGKEVLVVRVIGAVQGEHLQDTGLPLAGGYAHLRYFGGELSRSLGNTVLHVDRRHIGVRTLFEVNGNGHRTRITGGRSHVSHVFHTVYSLFQRSDYTLLKSFGACTVVGGAHHDGRRRNIRILLHRERKQTDDAQNDNRDGDDRRKNRAFYKCSKIHKIIPPYTC